LRNQNIDKVVDGGAGANADDGVFINILQCRFGGELLAGFVAHDDVSIAVMI